MIQIVHFIGQLREVKPTEYTDKNKRTVRQTELTMLFEGYDDDGYEKISVDTVKVDEEAFDMFFDKKGSYICVTYKYSVDEYGTSFRFDKTMPVTVFKENPFIDKPSSISKDSKNSPK